MLGRDLIRACLRGPTLSCPQTQHPPGFSEPTDRQKKRLSKRLTTHRSIVPGQRPEIAVVTLRDHLGRLTVR